MSTDETGIFASHIGTWCVYVAVTCNLWRICPANQSFRSLRLVKAYGDSKRTYAKEDFEEVWETDQVEIAAALVKIKDFALDFGTEYIAKFCHISNLTQIVCQRVFSKIQAVLR